MSESNRALEQARAQMQSIVEMVAALECDYDRLKELRGLKEAADECGNDAGGGDDDPVISGAELEELTELEQAAGDCESEDDARERIQEGVLDVQVRSDWQAAGETLEASEFSILLCTGGPAVRIVGELSQGEPFRAWIEYQDWGTPWIQLFAGVDSAALLSYCRQFYFGE